LSCTIESKAFQGRNCQRQRQRQRPGQRQIGIAGHDARRTLCGVRQHGHRSGGGGNERGRRRICARLADGFILWAGTNVSDYFTGSFRCFNPALSTDGRYVAFKAVSTGSTSGLTMAAINSTSATFWPARLSWGK
jgi:hypothetical protein